MMLQRAYLELPNARKIPSLDLWIGWVPQFSSRAEAYLYVPDETSVQEVRHVLSEAFHEVTVELSWKKTEDCVTDSGTFHCFHVYISD